MVNETSKERGPLSDQVAAQLRAERAAAGLTRAQIVERSGVPLSTYRKLELGERVADVMQLGRICRGLNLSMVTFMQRVEDRMKSVKRGEDQVG